MKKGPLANINMYVIFSVTLITVLGVTSLAPALPVISERLKVSAESIALLITAFTMPGIVLTPVMGILSDRYGRKTVLVPSLILFGVAGTSCAFTDSFSLLVTLRFFQGCGAAALGSLNMTLVGDIFQGRERITAMGYNGTVLSIATGLYPIIGGTVAMAGWNYPFMLASLAFPSALFVIIFLKNPPAAHPQKFSAYIKSSLTILNNRSLLILFATSLATFILLYGVLIAYFPFYMKSRFNALPFEIGAVISAASLATALAAANLGRLSARFTRKNLLVAAFVLYAAAILLSLLMNHILLMLIPTFIYGFANGLNMPNVNSLIADMAPDSNRGVIMSLNGMILRAGQTVGPMLGAMLFALAGMYGIFIGASAFAVVMALVIVSFYRPHPPEQL
jgi:MFS family permease